MNDFLMFFETMDFREVMQIYWDWDKASFGLWTENLINPTINTSDD